MRGTDRQQAHMWSYVTPEQRVPADHPLRPIREMVNGALKKLSRHFTKLYAKCGRPSIPPEMLMRALVLQVLYSVRSERLLMEQLEYNLLFRWFVGLDMDDPVWDATVFTKNRKRLLEGNVAQLFFERVLSEAQGHGLLSDEHFTVDGTQIEAWASQKSFKEKEEPEPDGEEKLHDPPPSDDDPGNPTVDFRGEKRKNDTHESTTDPEARLYKKGKGQEAKLSYLGHILMENRNGLAVNTQVTQATGRAEREAAIQMVDEIPGDHPVTVGMDKNYDTRELVFELRERNATPHVAQNNKNRKSNIDGRTTRHAGYEISQRKRKRIEEIYGWLKTVALMRRTRYRGREKVSWIFTLAVTVYNLVRIRNLIEQRVAA